MTANIIEQGHFQIKVNTVFSHAKLTTVLRYLDNKGVVSGYGIHIETAKAYHGGIETFAQVYPMDANGQVDWRNVGKTIVPGLDMSHREPKHERATQNALKEEHLKFVNSDSFKNFIKSVPAKLKALNL